ncbi:MAG: homoserine dehydrogenase [Anaerolineae bacterium]|nr:homoserine dehydrogenase [Anaerolineae bacterium]MDW8100383.1 homoserine dehydrogenase [Anaerolineae bacterium]
MAQVIRVALVGLGNVGRAFLELMRTKRWVLRERYGLELVLTGAADSTGAALGAGQIDPANLLRHKQAGHGAGQYPRLGHRGMPATEMVRQVEADVLLEASPVNVRTGQPGLDCVRIALQRGMSVILANKGPLVVAYRELMDLAVPLQSSSVSTGNEGGWPKAEWRPQRLRFSATVCGALPVLNMGQRDLVACEIQRIEGILNSTTNYILTAMEAGDSFDQALRQAQAEGVAESDPSLDIQGWDTANKLVIIANAVLGVPITLKDVDMLGIQYITPDDLAAARARGQTVKLVAVAQRQDGSYRFSVHPAALPLSHPLASITGWEMGIVWHTDIMGTQFAKVDERGPMPTAAAMLRDLINLYR